MMVTKTADIADRIADAWRRRTVARITADEWTSVAAAYAEVERHATGLAGDLILVRTPDGLAAVETPHEGVRVVRLLGDASAASAFVRHRLEQYERMWEGCGCRIDYEA